MDSKIPQNLTPATMVPLTPMRRFLGKFNLSLPIFSSGKRLRENPTSSSVTDYSNRQDTSSHSGAAKDLMSGDVSISSPKIVQRARVAIQQDDEPFDAIVITTLPCYPFCCHEDLLLMSRQQLIDVAATFNSHLPHIMKIEVSESVSDAHIRHCIERLAGIVPDIPAAPRRIKSWFNKTRNDGPKDFLGSKIPQPASFPSPPASPLAMRASRRRSFSFISTPPRMLERLEEEDERSLFSEERPLKKRKVSSTKATPTRFVYKPTGIDMDISPARPLKSPIFGEMILPPEINEKIPSLDDRQLEHHRGSLLDATDGFIYHEPNITALSLQPQIHRVDGENTTRMDIS